MFLVSCFSSLCRGTAAPPTATPTIFRDQEGVSSPYVVVVCVCAAVYFLMECVAMGILFARRRRRMLAARSPLILIMPLTITSLMFLSACASFITGRTETVCALLSYSYLFFFPLAALPYLLNFPAIVYADRLNKLKTSRVAGDNSFVWRIRFLFRDLSRLTASLVAGAIQIAVYLGLKYGGVVLAGGEEGVSPPGEEHDCYRLSLVVNAAFAMFYTTLLSWFAYKVTRVADPYYLKIELYFLCFVYCPMSILSVVYPTAPQIFPTSFDYRWITIIVSLAGFVAGVINPILLSFQAVEEYLNLKLYQFYKWRRRETSSIYSMDVMDANSALFALSEGVDVFKSVLENPTLLAAFSQFCVTNWSVENVLFYKDVERLRLNFLTTSPSDRKSKAEVMISEYVVPGAPLEINLEHHTRADLHKALKEGNLEESTFDAAQREIYELMKKDSFEKFQKTSKYRKAVETALARRGSSHDHSSDFQNSPAFSQRKLNVAETSDGAAPFGE